MKNNSEIIQHCNLCGKNTINLEPHKEDWIEEFDKKFPCEGYNTNTGKNEIKIFIQSLLEKEREKWEKEVVYLDITEKRENNIRQEERERILKEIEKILYGIDRKQTDNDGWWETSTGVIFGSKILEDIKQILK